MWGKEPKHSRSGQNQKHIVKNKLQLPIFPPQITNQQASTYITYQIYHVTLRLTHFSPWLLPSESSWQGTHRIAGHLPRAALGIFAQRQEVTGAVAHQRRHWDVENVAGYLGSEEIGTWLPILLCYAIP